MTAADSSKLKPEPERSYEAKTRLCLKCRKPFVSSWPGERVCPDCKYQTNWREGTIPLEFAVTDIWTFARNTQSRDPNWTLVATGTSN